MQIFCWRKNESGATACNGRIFAIKNSQIFLPGSAVEFDVLFQKNYNKGLINYFKLTENPHSASLSEEEIITGQGIKIENGEDLTNVVIKGEGDVTRKELEEELDRMLEKQGIDKNDFLSKIDKMANDAMDSGSPSNTIKEVNADNLKDNIRNIHIAAIVT